MRKTAAALSATLFAIAHHAAAEIPDRIVVRATSVLPDAATDVLIDVTQPLTVALEPAMQPETLLQAHCGGSVSKRYLQAFTDLNAGASPFAPRTKRIDIQMPGCVQIRRNATVAVHQGDNAETLLDRELGAKRQTKLLVCLPDQSDAACRVQPAGDVITQRLGPVPGRFDELAKPPSEVWLPFASNWTTLALKPGVTADVAIQRLRDIASKTLAGSDLLSVQQAPPMDLTAPLAADDPQLTAGPCSPTGSTPDDWPFDRRTVRDAIEAGAKFASEHFTGYPQRTVIRVSDTGVSRLEATPGFDVGFLAVNPLARQPSRSPAVFNGAYYGIDAEFGGKVTPLANDPHGDHGTEVADLALGTAAFRQDYPDLAKLIGLTVARVFSDRYSTTGVWVSTPMLESSLSYRPPIATVINFSVGGAQQIPSLEAVLPHLFEQRQLLVIAAGNAGVSLNRTPLYPATYAADGRVRAAMIVVGAYAPASPGEIVTRAAFSNYGRIVDLLAPGCRLPAPFGMAGTLAGTSFASPLVTFTASVLRAVLPDSDSKILRERLWASVRWVSEDIAEKTAFGGVLDIPAALRVFDDTVRLKGGKLLVGRWLDAQPFEGCAGGDAIDADSILRIRVEQRPDGPPVLHILTRNVGGDVGEEPSCLATERAFDLRKEDGQTVSLKWPDIDALIPAVDSADRRVPGPSLFAAPQPTARPQPTIPFNSDLGGGGGLFGRLLQQRGSARLALPNAQSELDHWSNLFPRVPDSAAAASVQSIFPEPSIESIQSALSAAGYPIVTDGALGSATSRAIRSFQLSRLEAPSGQLTKKQKRALVASLVGTPDRHTHRHDSTIAAPSPP